MKLNRDPTHSEWVPEQQEPTESYRSLTWRLNLPL